MKLFISYSSKDRDLVTALAEELDLLDHEVWFDPELNRSGGQKWWKIICEQIRGCEVFVNALSPHVLRSKPCELEHNYARALGKPVLPLLLVEIEYRQLPRDLQESQIVDFRERTGSQRRSLRDSLRNLPPCPALPKNALKLEPPVPLDPVGVAMDAIRNLPADSNVQKLLILDIDDLQEDEQYQSQVPELLRLLVKRDDVLTVRNLRRAEQLLSETVPQPSSRIEVVSPLEAKPVEPAQRPAVRNTHTTRFQSGQRVSHAKFGEGIVINSKLNGDDEEVEISFADGVGLKLLSANFAKLVTEPAPGERMTDSQGVTTVFVPAGKFLMGSTDGGSDERPQHEQIIKRAFWLDLTPVTNASYAEFAKVGYRTRELWTTGGWKWVEETKKAGPRDYDNFIDPQQPRVGVTWFEAYAYCRWRDGRLPTEAEWEWAARGPENRIYPWGNTFVSENGIWRENSGGKTAIVGDGIRTAGASWVNALDMSGNVWEWCSSFFEPYPFNETDGRESIDNTNGKHVLRGASWSYATNDLRSTRRTYYLLESVGTDGFGFRCARSYSEPATSER